jgi:periplasmic protein TonB
MTRRSIVAAISIFVHTFVLFSAMTAEWWRPITEWPTPRRAMAFVDETVRPVLLENIELPKPTATPSTRTSDLSQQNTAPTRTELAPAVAPAGVTSKTGGETTVTGGRGVPDIESPGGSPIGVIGEPVPPPPPPPREQTPIRLHSGIRAPQRIVNVTPEYPAIAREAHAEGLVIIEATIDERGNVVRAQVLKSRPLLDDAALAAVRQWKFTPTLLNGVAIPIVMTVTVNFSLAP